ncbi:coiled-coil domain-containing protein 42 homolog [Chelmon rostratus]|uniref:coiled-coil domain-containing protein 42 homolog n=1 Tax=Chelmon rostratus TaxID=109905 RepID=UPI001BE7206B|nr:coiled-coil domain-containing protein 42 homolog [Chelmon rostratus]
MDTRTARESQNVPAGASAEVTGGLRDRTAALLDLRTRRREEEQLHAQQQQREKVLESLQHRRDELHKKLKEIKELHSGFDMFLKVEDANQAAEKERVRKEVLQREAERLKEEYAELMERKQGLQHQVHKHTVYMDFMERVVKLTKFEDVQPLMDHLESLLHFRDQLYQKASQAQEQVDQQRKALPRLEDQYHLLRLHKTNQLSQLQTELQGMFTEALKWEGKWNHIQETAAKKTLLLGQIKMATLSLYEMTEDKAEGEEGVDMNDTEKQLDKVKMFIQDHDDVLKEHRIPLHKHNDGQERKEERRDEAKKRIAAHCKKD